MSNVLTAASTVLCGHAGNVSVQPTPKLMIGGNAALLKTGINGKSVGGCTTETDANKKDKQCSTVTAVTAGEAKKLTVQGQGVMLDTLEGGTDGLKTGKPQKALSATAAQTKLTAI